MKVKSLEVKYVAAIKRNESESIKMPALSEREISSWTICILLTFVSLM